MGKIRPDDYGYSLEVNEDYQKLNSDKSIDLVVKGHDHSAWYGKVGRTKIVCTGSLRERFGGFVRIDEDSASLAMYSFEEEQVICIGEHKYK
jgi:predicted phosphodiesterase